MKTININKVSIKEITFIKDEKIVVVVPYSLVGEDKEYDLKRIQFDNLTPAQVKTIENIFDFIEDKIEKIEKIK